MDSYTVRNDTASDVNEHDKVAIISVCFTLRPPDSVRIGIHTAFTDQ